MGEMADQDAQHLLENSNALSLDEITRVLENNTCVKVAGIDCDGVLRGKIMMKEKFLSSIGEGFGMSSAIFGWDMHDVLYTTETKITSAESGYADILAIPDLRSFRRIPWEDNIPFFLLNFVGNGKSIHADGRSMLRDLCKDMRKLGYTAKAGSKFVLDFAPLIESHGARS